MTATYEDAKADTAALRLDSPQSPT